MHTQNNGSLPGKDTTSICKSGDARTILHLHADGMDGVCWDVNAQQLSIFNTLDDDAAPAGAFVQGVIPLSSDDLIALGNTLILLGQARNVGRATA